jgi:hypothetical protein
LLDWLAGWLAFGCRHPDDAGCIVLNLFCFALCLVLSPVFLRLCSPSYSLSLSLVPRCDVTQPDRFTDMQRILSDFGCRNMEAPHILTLTYLANNARLFRDMESHTVLTPPGAPNLVHRVGTGVGAGMGAGVGTAVGAGVGAGMERKTCSQVETP